MLHVHVKMFVLCASASLIIVNDRSEAVLYVYERIEPIVVSNPH